MNHPLLQLFLARLREFYREPIALFWVYGFPLILAVGLGFAFRDRKPEPAQVDVAQSSGARSCATVCVRRSYEIVERESAKTQSGVFGERGQEQRRDRHQHQPGGDGDADDQQNIRLARTRRRFTSSAKKIQGPVDDAHVSAALHRPLNRSS